MADFTAQDVKRLRDMTGAGMMDAKRALQENDGDFEAAKQWLREKGLAKSAERSDRESTQGAVALARVDNVAALVQLKCETDFVAKNADFVNTANDIAELVAKQGEGAVEQKAEAIDDLKITLKENIGLGRVARIEAKEGQILDTYLHVQEGRGVNGVVVLLEGGDQDLAHEVAVNVAFAKPAYLRREDVPAEEVEAERATLEAQTRNEGKPEAALDKIVTGKLDGWFKRMPGGVLLEQPYAKDEKKSIKQLLGDADVVEFAQVLIG
ncbi:MAG TPA: translation elongation factor Ts [Acidimicrobiales bacterium]|jgi:elongation factor Ts|nr:translation elongation factor Ts [Acidimicrobiales bacterium]